MARLVNGIQMGCGVDDYKKKERTAYLYYHGWIDDLVFDFGDSCLNGGRSAHAG